MNNIYSKYFHNSGPPRGKRGFTLIELVITIVLFALVAGLVISFITYMSNFDSQNERMLRFIEQSQSAREEVDFWFSAYDRQGCSVAAYGDAPQSEGTAAVLARASVGGREYRIYRTMYTPAEGSATDVLVFEYPPDGQYHGAAEGDLRVARVECAALGRIALYDMEGWTFTETTDENVVRFTIDMHVDPSASYACEIVMAAQGEAA